MVDNPTHIKLKRDALQGLLSHTNMDSAKRAEMEGEVKRLDYQLAAKYADMEWEIEPE
ncbi:MULTISPECIES: hypothetical protein [Streptomyces]|uniref:hypothetical protein n=1 Tax=Streptomyces TaxID=1883 RepID=UPI0033991E54